MIINLNLKDRHGQPLGLGDKIELFDWGGDHASLGTAELVLDQDIGSLNTLPRLVEDQYDFYTKALPKCLLIEKAEDSGPLEEFANKSKLVQRQLLGAAKEYKDLIARRPKTDRTVRNWFETPFGFIAELDPEARSTPFKDAPFMVFARFDETCDYRKSIHAHATFDSAMFDLIASYYGLGSSFTDAANAMVRGFREE